MRVLFFAIIGVVAGVISAPVLSEPQSSGSGFAIGDGSIIVTSNHVVEGCSAINIPHFGGAIVLKFDARADLAILKPSRSLPTGLRFRSGHPVKLGEEVVVIGYPLRGLLSSPPTVTTGIISSLAGLRDDRTEMQISAPVQTGNSGGPVLDRSGNVVGVVESKLDAVKAAMKTGDIPQNVNFAVHSAIVTSLLDSYAINYDLGIFDAAKPISDIVAAALPAVVVLECERQAPPPALTSSSRGAPPPEPAHMPTSQRSALVCGRSVDYIADEADTSRYLGVWVGNWNSSDRLCGGLIVEKIRDDRTAEIIYVYGPSKPGSRLTWKQQHRTGFLTNDGKLSFRDDQGSMFVFDIVGSDMLNATFSGGTGRLAGSFQKIR